MSEFRTTLVDGFLGIAAFHYSCGYAETAAQIRAHAEDVRRLGEAALAARARAEAELLDRCARFAPWRGRA